jgi:uncharacterized protein
MRAMRGRAFVVMVLALVSSNVGCGDPEPAASVTVEITHGTATVPFVVEVASSPRARQRGLMGRESLPADGGMLFLFPKDVALGFWMKDTLIPLDIAFIDGDRIVEIRSMQPCRTASCPLTTPSHVYDAALEVNEGSFGRAGVSAGDRVTFSGALPKVS